MTELAPKRERDVVVVLHRPSPVELTSVPADKNRQLWFLVAVNVGATGMAELVVLLLPALSFLKPLVVGLVVFLSLMGAARLPTWLRRQRLRAVPEWNGPARPPAACVRWTGIIQPEGEPFMAPDGTGPIVYARTHYRAVTRHLRCVEEGREEIRGVPFRVSAADGQSVLVTPSQIWLVDPDRKVHKLTEEQCSREGVRTTGKGRKYQQTVLRVGDRVEVVGHLEHEVSRDGRAAPGRGVPTDLVVRPASKGMVWIRRV